MATHNAVVTLSTGDLSVLQYKKVPTPPLGPEEVKIQVLAAGVNNTDINTRIGWYDKQVNTATADVTATEHADDSDEKKTVNGYSDTPTPWPLIQGTDCAGIIVDIGEQLKNDSVHLSKIGKRCIVAACQGTNGWSGSDFDGGFQEYIHVDYEFVHAVENNTITHEELGALPCAFGTAENMLLKVNLTENDTIVVPGASGGVGSAVVELCGVCRSNINVIAIVGPGKSQAMLDKFGAFPNITIRESRHGLDSWSALMDGIAKKTTVVVDNVGGPSSMDLISTLKKGGRYVTSGAIAGPIINLDLRTLYLNDISMYGSTTWVPGVMANLVTYVDAGKLKPLVSATFHMSKIAEAQESFLKKQHVGKIVLLTDKGEETTRNRSQQSGRV